MVDIRDFEEPQQPTSAAAWKGKRSSAPMPVKVPSGNTALCRRVGMETFLKLGLIPNSLMGIIQKHMGEAQQGKQVDNTKVAEELGDLLKDPTKINDLLSFADEVVCFICVQPKVLLTPDDPNLRQEEELYVDEVDMEDKMFLFQWAVGGTESVETFREESGVNVAGVDNV